MIYVHSKSSVVKTFHIQMTYHMLSVNRWEALRKNNNSIILEIYFTILVCIFFQNTNFDCFTSRNNERNLLLRENFQIVINPVQRGHILLFLSCLKLLTAFSCCFGYKNNEKVEYDTKMSEGSGDVFENIQIPIIVLKKNQKYRCNIKVL